MSAAILRAGVRAMSQNEVIAFEANFKRWCDSRGKGLRFDSFLYYTVEHFLRKFDPPDEDLLAGIMDKKCDGGVDAIYFLLDGEVVRENTDLSDAKPATANLAIFQTRGDEGFSPIAVDKFYWFTDDLLDLSREPSRYKTKYHSKLLDFMRVFKEKYKEISGAFPDFSIDYYYVVRKDAPNPNDDCVTAQEKVEAKAREHFDKCKPTVRFVNIQALSEQVQIKPKTTATIVWEDSIRTNDGFLGLVTIPNYYKFIQDDNGALSRRMFEANVRGFQGRRRVNDAIANTLEEPKPGVDFWFLNNGITVIASDESTIGKNQLTLTNPLVVNGLQTSRLIYDHLKNNKADISHESRCLIVRVIKTTEVAVRDAIIYATNNQNRMPGAALRATDRIHRQIEELFPSIDLYYDRRPGHYKDEGKPVAKIVSMTELVQAMLAIVFQQPNDARGRPSDYISRDDKYLDVFRENKFPLPVYLVAIQLLRKVETWLAADQWNLSNQIQRNYKFYLLSDLVCEKTKSAEPNTDQIVRIDLTTIDDKAIAQSYSRVSRLFLTTRVEDQDQVAKGADLVKVQRRQLKRRYATKEARI